VSAASIRGMRSHLAPVLRVVDASAAAEWYARHLGFTTEFEHRFEPGLPLYVGLVRDDARIHLSEHTGDARPGTLVYLWVPDVDSVAAACGVSVIDDNPWGRDFEVTDADGNRIRVGTPHPRPPARVRSPEESRSRGAERMAAGGLTCGTHQVTSPSGRCLVSRRGD
jgi:catechol 2,3-dioxygenase-like lactoylglutathione lyase family enzyme